jgi:hypothetical protein
MLRLLIFGNPATRSIKSGMFFAPKHDGKENRFRKHVLSREDAKNRHTKNSAYP